MNTAFKILSALIFTGVLCAYGNDTIRKSMKLTIKTSLPPQAKTTGTVGANSSNAKSQWVEVDLKFHTNDEKVYRRRFIDDPEFAVELAVYPQNSSKERSVIFSGKAKYWTVEQDGRDHFMKLLLPAVLFRRYAYDRTVDRVLFVAKGVLSVNGEVIGTAYGSSKGMALKDIQKFFRLPPKNAIKAPDTMTGRAGTSWEIIEVNRYELEKRK